MIRSPRVKASLVGAIALVVFVLVAGPADAREGRLDPAYGQGGIAMTGLGTAGSEPGVEITVDGASALVAAGSDGTAVRLLPDGSLDTSFGQDGRFVVAPGSPLGDLKDREFFPSSLTIDHRGRVLAFGSVLDTAREAQGEEGSPVSPNLAAVLRYGAAGELDSSFGGGKGYAIGRFGLSPELLTGFPRIAALAGKVDAENRPIFVAGAAEKVEGCEAKGTVEYVPRALVRLTAAGGRDRHFGTAGVTPIFGSGEFPSLGVDARSRPVVGIGNVGSHAAACGEGSILYRFRGDGALLPHGRQVFKSMHLAVVQPSGATILSESRGSTIEVARLRPDGSRQVGFGHDGVARVRLPRVAASHVLPAAVDGQGRIILVGNVDSAESKGKNGGTRQSSLVIGRLLPDGRLDGSFGKDGWLFTDLPRTLELPEVQATLDSKGRLLVAGRYLLGS
jgi:uncharacterized delta-60 repeat protein